MSGDDWEPSRREIDCCDLSYLKEERDPVDFHTPHWLRGRGRRSGGSKVPWKKRKAERRAKTKAAKRHKAYMKEIERQKLNRKEAVCPSK